MDLKNAGFPWTFDQAIEVMRQLALPFSHHGYFLAILGAVAERGSSKSDLDMIAVPAELSITHPREMERLMCGILDATPDGEPVQGFLGTWSRACFLRDGRMIDIQYRLLPSRPEFGLAMDQNGIDSAPYHWI